MSGEEPVTKKRRNRWGQAAADDEAAAAAAAPAKVPVAQFDLGATAAAAREAMEKAKMARDRQTQIAAQMAAQGLGQQPQTGGGGPRKLMLDEFGREVDERGQVVPMKKANVSTLQVNSKSASAKKQAGERSAKSFVDPYLRTKKDDKKQEQWQRKRRFNFNEDDGGKWARRAEETEKKKIELKKEQEYKDKKAGKKEEEPSTDNPNLMPLGEGAAPQVKLNKKSKLNLKSKFVQNHENQKKYIEILLHFKFSCCQFSFDFVFRFVRPDPPPDCEWWDQVLVRDVEEKFRKEENSRVFREMRFLASKFTIVTQ